MAKDDGVNVPTGFGGLLRFKEEYESFFKLTPTHVILLLILILGFVVVLNLLFKIQ